MYIHVRAALLLAVSCVLVFCVTSRAGEAAAFAPTAQPDVTVLVDGEPLMSDVPVHIGEGRTLLPVRAVAETLGAEVEWDGDSRKVIITRGLERIVLEIDSRMALFEAQSLIMDVPAIIINDRTFVPVRFVSETLGALVDWENDTRTVVITDDTTPEPLVFGYYLGHDTPEPGESYNSTEANCDNLDAVIIASYYLRGDGSLHPESYDSEALFKLAHDKQLPLMLLVKNAGFSRDEATRLLASSEAQQRAAANLLASLQKGYMGINIDFENVDPKDRPRYTDFISNLSRTLRLKGYLVTLSVPAKSYDNPDQGWSGAFDYAALAKSADYMMVMAYDQHWGNGSVAGPIAGIPWVRKMVDYAVTAVPRSKLILGVPGYAYDWITGTTTAQSMAAYKAVSLAANNQTTVQFDEVNQTSYFDYTVEGVAHEVHFEDARALKAKLELVNEYRLNGVALWRLGYEVPGVWDEIETWRQVGD